MMNTFKEFGFTVKIKVRAIFRARTRAKTRARLREMRVAAMRPWGDRGVVNSPASAFASSFSWRILLMERLGGST